MMDLLSVFFRNSLFASVMILAVLAVRPLLRKAPRNICCLLWLLVALRLLLPFQLESPLSLQPDVFEEPSQITVIVETESPAEDILPIDPPVIDVPQHLPSEAPVDPAPQFQWETVLPVLWICGALSLLIYSAVSYFILKHRVWDAVMASDGAWESDRIEGAFLLGYFLPKIYLPIGLHQQDREFIIAHERSHQSRGDHWWKLLGMLCLSIHWYNPLVWLSYALLCRDIETACDERVISTMELEQRRAYSFALLNCGKRLSGFLVYPVAFGEISLKQRIKSVLSYRKPGIWVTLGALVLAAVIVVCFMTTPDNPEPVTIQKPPVTDVQPDEPDDPTEAPTLPTTEPTQVTTLPTEPATEPTEPTTPATEPVTTKPEVIPTQPKPTEPKPAEPSVTLPRPTEPTVPPVTRPQPTEPSVPPVTVPQPPKPTDPPVIVPTEPTVTKPVPETIGGSCGDYAVWEYNDDTRQLKISGHGALDPGSKPGWNAYSNRITSVVIGEGITSICTNAFAGCESLRSVRLPYGLQTIDNYAFAWTDLRQVTIPGTVTKINCRAFCGCDALTRITFTGNPPKINNDAFSSVTASAYYPEQNGLWRFALSSYGGDLAWELCCSNHSYINGVCERCGLAKS